MGPRAAGTASIPATIAMAMAIGMKALDKDKDDQLNDQEHAQN